MTGDMRDAISNRERRGHDAEEPSRRHSRFKPVPFIGITGITGISASREFFTGAFRHLKQLLPRFKNVSHKPFPVNFSACDFFIGAFTAI
jgi:hypothetical protein